MNTNFLSESSKLLTTCTVTLKKMVPIQVANSKRETTQHRPDTTTILFWPQDHHQRHLKTLANEPTVYRGQHYQLHKATEVKMYPIINFNQI